MEIKSFTGLRNVTSPERFKVGDLSIAKDVDLDDTGRLLTRRGFTRASATALHSLYGNGNITVAVSGTNLVRINSDFSVSTLKALTTTAPVSYDSVGDTIYYSNGVDKGRIVNQTWSCWGVTPPVGQPSAVATTGNLPAGRYLYALTFVRSDGFESGTGVSGQIDLVVTGGVAFTNIEVSTNAEVTDKILYISGTNGEVQYRAKQIPNAQTSFSYTGNQMDFTIPLMTQFKDEPPAGTLVRSFNSVNYVVSRDTVFHSDAYGLETFCLEDQFMHLPGQIVMFEPVVDGVYIATADTIAGEDSEETGAVWFFHGKRPDAMQAELLFDYGVIPGTGVRTDSEYFDTPTAGDAEGAHSGSAVLFTTRHGIIIGRDGGNTTNLTESKYSLVSAERGASFIRQSRGYVSYITTLQGPGSLNNNYIEEL